ncbi:MAG: PLP-dependent aminotransferase family protein [Bacteroidetes bacterium]|nr:PLP-dependent aminotransferase family protein [Bacteroidota bacterium]
MKTKWVVSHDEFLYQQVSEKLESMIAQGVLKTGQKLPSVRSLSKEQDISMSTAFKAYLELEGKGLIEARPKSGYYVRYTPGEFLPVPVVHHEYRDPKKVKVDEMIALVYENLKEEGIVRLSLAAPATELLPEAKLNKAMHEAIRRSPDSCIGYERIQGNVMLRKQIARYAFNWGGNINEHDVVTTQGCMEALVFCLKAVTEPGDTVAIECPTYFGIFNVMQSLGLKVLEIPTVDTGVDLDYLQKAIDRVKIKACLFVTNFNNPLGSCMPEENKKRLVKMLAAKEIPLIEDDIYGELYFGKTRPHTCKSYDKKGLVLLCASVSKSLAPGYRVGWCIPGKYKDKVLQMKLMHAVSSATPTQAAIGLFFEKGRVDLHMRQLRKALYTQCLLYTQAITTYFPPDTKVSRPQGGYVLWVEMNRKVNAFDIFQEAMEHHISIAPGQIFSTDARFENCMRISFGMPYSKEIDRSLKTLGTLVKEAIIKKQKHRK